MSGQNLVVDLLQTLPVRSQVRANCPIACKQDFRDRHRKIIRLAYVVELCGGDEGADGSPADATTVGATEEMVFTAERDRPDRALDWIVVELDAAVTDKAAERLPAREIASARALWPGMRASSVSTGFGPVCSIYLGSWSRRLSSMASLWLQNVLALEIPKERSNDTETLPLRPFYRGYIVATRGYDFREG
jgi:hypothetical protein